MDIDADLFYLTPTDFRATSQRTDTNVCHDTTAAKRWFDAPLEAGEQTPIAVAPVVTNNGSV